MKYANWIYGGVLAILALILKTVEYRYSVRDLSTEALTFTIAVLFAGLGLWAGWQLSKKRPKPAIAPTAQIHKLGISKREFEILQLVAQGSTNQEIADQLFISLNTVKTHLSNLYQKLDVRRRTQAVEKGKQLGLLDWWLVDLVGKGYSFHFHFHFHCNCYCHPPYYFRVIFGFSTKMVL